jgi:tetratricopeptide (TPR) repeat protein
MSLARTLAWINIRDGWRIFFWAGFLALLAALLDALPLFNLLGYDFSFAMGLATALAGVDIGHGTVVSSRRAGRELSPARAASEAIVATWAVLVIPLLLSLANALRVRNCNLQAGLAFFALLPACTGAYAAGTGAVVASVVRGRSGRIAAFALPFMSVAWALWRLYRDPAVFAFDPFAGYFPGPIYDEALRPPMRLVWYRLANATWLATAIATTDWLCRGSTDAQLRPARDLLKPRLALVVLLLAGSLGWYEARGALGFHIRRADLVKTLPRETRSEHFVLRSDRTAESDADIALAMQDLEFRYFQLQKLLGVEPRLPVRVYRFPSASAKKDAVGAATTLFARPWSSEIFVQADRFPAQRLRHELAHVFASAFGDRLFGVSLAWHFHGPIPWPTLASGLVEGLAEAADFDNPDGRATTHEEAAAMLALALAPDLRRSLGSGFTFESGPRAYTIVGSFSRYLLETYGAEKLRALYRSAGDSIRVYGRDLPSLESEWRAFLARLPIDANSRADAEETFRRPAIFQKVCARELAARVAEAHSMWGTAPTDAIALLASACTDDPNEPTYRLDLAEAQMAAGQSEQALTTIAEARATGTLTRPLRVRAANLEATMLFNAERFDEIQAVLTDAGKLATDDGDVRTVRAKQRALRDEVAQKSLGRVLFGDENGRPLDARLVVYLLTEFAHQFPDEALGPYLVGRQLAPRDPALAVGVLGEACGGDAADMRVPLDAMFTKECRRMLGESAFLAGDLEAARDSFNWLAAHAERESDRLRAQDFLHRIAWLMAGATDAGSGTTRPHD